MHGGKKNLPEQTLIPQMHEALIESMSTSRWASQVGTAFRQLNTAYRAHFNVSEGCGLYTGLNSPLKNNIERFTRSWATYAEKLSVLGREAVERAKAHGFTDTQAAVCAKYFQARVIFAEQPTEVLYGTAAVKSKTKRLKGLWNVPVQEPANCQMRWPEVCETMSTSIWACDENPFQILESLFEAVVEEMHDPRPGFASAVWADIECVKLGNPGRYLMQMILDAQLHLRAARAFVDETETVFLPDAVRLETMDGVELVDIVRVRKSNALFDVTQTPRKLYDKEFGLFAECRVRLSDQSVHITCLPVGVVHYIFGWRADFNELLSKAR